MWLAVLSQVIVLIGSGWSFVKPFLSDRDKRIVMIILPLQVLNNVALVVTEEENQGNADWAAWRDILHLFDIICCCAILFPIVWSIKHLREAAATGAFASHVFHGLLACTLRASWMSENRYYNVARRRWQGRGQRGEAHALPPVLHDGGVVHLLHADYSLLAWIDVGLAVCLDVNGGHARYCALLVRVCARVCKSQSCMVYT